MKNKRYIYSWLLFLMAAFAATGCSTDELAQKDSVESPSTLTFSVRSVNSEESNTSANSPTTDVESYIHELRFIAFNEDGSYFLNELFTWNGTTFVAPAGSKTTVVETNENVFTITKEDFSASGGTFSFYVIANETGYLTNTPDKPTEKLGLPDVLKNCTTLDTWETYSKLYFANIHRIPRDNPNRVYVLMTAHHEQLIIGGKNNDVKTVDLVRTISKVDFTIKKGQGAPDNIYVKKVELVGKRAERFGLFEPIEFDTEKSQTGYTDDKVLFDEHSTDYENRKTLTEAGLKVDKVTLTERILKNKSKENALQIRVTVSDGIRDKVYQDIIYVGPTGSIMQNNFVEDYDIPRNTHYTIVATLGKWEAPLDIYLQATPWTSVTQKYEISANGTFDLSDVKVEIDQTNTNDKFVKTTYQSGTTDLEKTTATFKLKMTAPVGVKWEAHLTNSEDFVFYNHNETDETQRKWVTGRGDTNSEFVEFSVVATNTLTDSNAAPETELYVTLMLDINASDKDKRQVIDINGRTDPTSENATSQTSILIKQVSTLNE